MPVSHYGSRRISGEIPQQGPDPFAGHDFGFALISGSTVDYELVRTRSAALTLSEHGVNNIGKLDTLISVRTAFIIRETVDGVITIG